MPIKRTLALLVPILLPVLLASCAAVAPPAAPGRLMAERPREEPFRTALKQESSTLNIPIEATAADLARVLNQAVRKELYKGATKTRGLGADVVRNGAIGVSAADNYLQISLPLAVTLSYGMFETRPIPLSLSFKVRATVTPDWRLQTEVQYLGIRNLVAEEIGIGPLSFKPRSIVEGIAQPLQKMLSEQVTQKINEQIPLRSLVGQVWERVQKPVQLDKKYNAWLRLTPREVLFYPLAAQNNRVWMSIGIVTFAELVVGPEPPAQPRVPLPGLRQVASFDKGFRIALNADLFYRDLKEIAARLLLNKRFDSDGKQIVVKGLDLYGNGDRLVVKLQTEGDLEGVFYLTARPRFNPQTNLFSIEDVDFDMQTRNLLLQSADWLLHGTLRGLIQDRLNMNLGEQLERTRTMAAAALSRIPLAEHVALTGEIRSLGFNEIIMQEDRISIRVHTEGQAGIVFQ